MNPSPAGRSVPPVASHRRSASSGNPGSQSNAEAGTLASQPTSEDGANVGGECSPATRQALEQTLRQKFDLVIRSYSFGPQQIEFAALRNPESLLDEVTLEQSHEEMAWQPYWGQVWPSSLGMGQALVAQDLAGRRVIDLGCGLGVPGTVAAACGARVWFVDNALPALDFVRWNSWPWRDRVEILSFDWRRGHPLPWQFDIIMGSDILYAREDVPYLDRFWRQHLAAGGHVVLSEPCRLLTLDILPQVRAAGWSVAMRPRVVEPSGEKVNLLTLTRQG